jgi:hypothetical protein
MKRLFAASFLIFVLILAILAPVLPVFAAAVPVTVDPIIGPPGTQITVWGNSFTAGKNYTVTFSIGFTTPVKVSEGKVTAGGLASATFLVPAIPRGQYAVKITTDTDTTNPPVPTFTITPQIALDTATGNVADQINVNGNGFNPSQIINIYFDTSVIASVTTDAQGAFYSTVVTIPQATAGKHTILAKDDSGSTPGVTFSIGPTITLSANDTTVGSTITVSGIGFASSKTIFVSIDDRPVSGTITSDSNGKFTSFNLKIPELIGGNHAVTANDSLEYTAKTDFSVSPSISINPDHGVVGTTITVTGNGFLSVTDNPITIAFNGMTVVTNPETVTAGINGSFGVTFKIPTGSGSAGTITVSDRFSTLSTTFNSAASINVNPLSGHVGTAITATGIGFKSVAVIKINYDGTEVGTTTTDTDGKFTTTFSALASAMGNHQITITDQVSTLQSAFSVTPEVKTDISSGSVGQDISASGTGFTAGSNITVKYDTNQVTTTATDKNGNFSLTFKVPASKGGNHQITFTDGTHIIFTDGTKTPISLDFSMDSTAPSAPVLLSPASSSKATKTPTLKWQDVTDPSGITYSLQIANDATFTILEFQKDGLQSSEYTLTSQDILGAVNKDTPYYWRVKAVDGANNQSDWSAPFTFYTSEVSKKSNYVLIVVGICVVVGGIAFLIEWLRRR